MPDRFYHHAGAERALPLLACGALATLLIASIGVLVAYLVISWSPDRPSPAPPDDPAPADVVDLPAALGIGTVTFDPTGQYAFPLAADPAQFVWTYTHWDGSNAVDIEIRPGITRAEFDLLARVPLVAITAGTVTVYNGSAGGLGYMLRGDDGLDYYYGHMAEQVVDDGAAMIAGQPLGVMGNTGASAQFIEPHLHFAIGPRDSLWTQPPAVNAAEQLAALFGLAWEDRPADPVPFAVPEGWPVDHPALHVITPFDQSLANGLAQPAIELGFADQVPYPAQDVIATLDGEINVIRWTDHYGSRLQITNRASQTTVVISGVETWLVNDGDTVTRGQVVGRWIPASRPTLHYMIFQNGVIIDPTPTLAPTEPDEPGP